MTNINNIHDQNKTLKTMKKITSYVDRNVANADNIHKMWIYPQNTDNIHGTWIFPRNAENIHGTWIFPRNAENISKCEYIPEMRIISTEYGYFHKMRIFKRAGDNTHIQNEIT